MSYSTSVLTPRTLDNVKDNEPANPVGTTSTVGVHAGLAISFTPTRTGRVMVIVQADGANATLADGAAMQVRNGTGTAPANGAALVGTAQGKSNQNISPAAANIFPLICIVIISGLAVGTPFWFDVSEAAVTGGTATLTNIVFDIIEL